MTRPGRAEEVADAFRFLANAQASYVTAVEVRAIRMIAGRKETHAFGQDQV
jgi:hypothetical protein